MDVNKVCSMTQKSCASGFLCYFCLKTGIMMTIMAGRSQVKISLGVEDHMLYACVRIKTLNL